MRRLFVDANVFIRFFTRDDRGRHRRAAGLLRHAAAGEVLLVTGPPVLFEVAWTLRAAYELSRESVLGVLARIAAFPGLELTDAALVERALRLATDCGVEFADAYIAAGAEMARTDGVATFNRRDFGRMDATVHEF